MMVPFSKIQQTRAHYIAQMQIAVRAASPVHLEPALRNSDGSLALEGMLSLPFRPDLVPKAGGPPIMVDSTLRMQFEPWEYQLGTTGIHLTAFIWDCVALKLSGVAAEANWDPLRHWFLREFDTEDHNPLNSEGFYGVVHFMSDPEPIADGSKITIDLGSAPIECFDSLFEALLSLRPTLIEVA
jgi:hypothetical protein